MLFKKILKKIKKVIVFYFHLIVWNICRIFSVDNRKIVISNYTGRGYGDNPKYIVEELLKRAESTNIIWLIRNPIEGQSLPSSVKSCKFDSVKAIYHLSTAKVWIDNCRKNFALKKKEQFYLQTWHGFALKRIEKDAEDNLPSQYCSKAKRDSKLIDVIISDSTFMSGIYKNSFWYEGEVVEYGSPRNDNIIKNVDSITDKVKSYFNIDNSMKIVLYAPTFRADYSLKAYSIDCSRVREACQKRFGSSFALMIRLHPNIADKCDFLTYDNRSIFNATPYDDMQELLMAADIVISDYSSLMFDFALSGKPCFQFATDIEEYKNDRNFYFPLEDLPFDMCENNDCLENSILKFDNTDYEYRLKKFYDSVGMITDGKASQKCVDLILNQMSNAHR